MQTSEAYLKILQFDTKLLELVRLHISQLNECAFCIDMHFKEAVAAGEDQKKLYSLKVWRDVDYYSEEERAVLNWAELIALNQLFDEEHTQEAFDQLKPFFSTADIANLTFVITQMISWNHLSKAFGFEPGHYRVGQY